MVANEGGEGVTVHPTPFNQETVLDSAKKYIEQVVNNGEVKHEGEDINWVRFCKCDLNDKIRNPIFHAEKNGTNGQAQNGSTQYEPGLILLLGYNTGIQAWYLQGTNEAREVLSIRNGLKCRTALILPTPANDQTGKQLAPRPWLGAVNGAELKLISLSSAKTITSIMCDGIIEEIEASDRIIIISSQSTISIYSNATTELIYIIKDCMVPGRDINPFCLGKRLIAYGPDKIDMGQQSLGGYLAAGQRSYTATMLSAAKTLGKGLSYLGETVGKMAGNNPRNYRATRDDEQKIKGHRGIVSVLDIELLIENKNAEIGKCIVAHWVGHPQPLGACAFNQNGGLLVTTDITGRDFHIFSINVHPLASSDSSVHHLYTLQRGDTTAQIHSFCFSNDSRFLAAVTRRGTTHVFPINPYGGAATVRTHCNPRVTNQRSLFQISAGMDQLVIRNQPRLPPFPNPTVVQPVVQIKQGAILGLLPPGIAIETNEDTADAVFGYNKTAVAFGRDIITQNSRNQPSPECLYVFNQYGKLSEFSLDARGAKQHTRITDESPLEVTANSIRQWNLQRMRNNPEVKVPLAQTNSLLLATAAVTTGCGNNLKAKFESKRQRTASMSSRLAADERRKRMSCNNSPRSRHSSTDEYEDQANNLNQSEPPKTEWMSKIEMSTYDGPARRLWMGPQFKFSIQNNGFDCFNRTSAVLHSEEEMKQSAPMPIARRRREASSGNHTIEVGSGHFDRINQLEYGSYCSGEEKVSEKLREAMNDIEIDCDRRISETRLGMDPPSDDEADLIEAVGEFDLQQSYNSSQNSLQFPN